MSQKACRSALLGTGPAATPKRQQTIPRIKAVDGHLKTGLWASFYLAKVVVDHCRQFFSGLFSFAIFGSGRPWLSGESDIWLSAEFIFPSPSAGRRGPRETPAAPW